MGVNYRYYWDALNGAIIPENELKYPVVKLSTLIKKYVPEKLKKGALDDEYYLVGLENIEPFKGTIRDDIPVSEIGSDKIVFGDSDFLFSKLRPYLGKLIFNDKSKKYIGTTELLPYTIRTDQVNKIYLKQILLSSLFIEKCSLLMYGKQHPRIHGTDFINMKIPLPSKPIQDEICKIIAPYEEELNKLKSSLPSIQKIIDDVLINTGIKSTDNKSFPDWYYYNANFGDISKKINLRLGSRYNYFWKEYNGELFKVKDNIELIELNEIVEELKTDILKKGILEEETILIELINIKQKRGKINDYSNVVSEIGSNKIVFEDADIIISKINPYLGHVFINDKQKKMIGSTELVPYIITNDDFDVKYLRYLLLSKDYLLKSSLLMYGKTHPRIHKLDLLKIKVPNLSKQIQNQIIKEIEEEEIKIEKIESNIAYLTKTKYDIFWELLKI